MNQNKIPNLVVTSQRGVTISKDIYVSKRNHCHAEHSFKSSVFQNLLVAKIASYIFFKYDS